MKNQTKRMLNESKIVIERKMVNNDLYAVLLEIAKTYSCAYDKTLKVDDGEYDYLADTIDIERIFDDVLDFVYNGYEGASNARRLNRRISEFNRIRDHYTNEDHIEYKF